MTVAVYYYYSTSSVHMTVAIYYYYSSSIAPSATTDGQ